MLQKMTRYYIYAYAHKESTFIYVLFIIYRGLINHAYMNAGIIREESHADGGVGGKSR